MSASFFDTILTVDARTNPDNNRGAQYAAPGTQQPRWTTGGGRGSWASVHVHAETAIQIAAQTIADTPMDGLTGDHPTKRLQMVAVLDAVAAAVRELALDADCDGALTDADWEAAVHTIRKAVTLPFPDPDARRVTSLEILPG